MWRLKGCPRCSGDLYINEETDGWYERCLLCGYVRDITHILLKHQGAVITRKMRPPLARALKGKEIRDK